MKTPRLIYLFLIAITILTGLLSRHYKSIPLFAGDILWATMVYFIMRFLFIRGTIKQISIYSLLFYYGIEFSQLYKAPWIDNLRHTLFGRLVLGDTFLWGDLLCYTICVVLGIFVDIMVNNNKIKG